MTSVDTAPIAAAIVSDHAPVAGESRRPSTGAIAAIMKAIASGR